MQIRIAVQLQVAPHRVPNVGDRFVSDEQQRNDLKRTKGGTEGERDGGRAGKIQVMQRPNDAAA